MANSQDKRVVGHTLNIVRYTTQELIDFVTDLFYENVATDTNMYFMDKVSEQGQIRPRTRLEQRKKRIEDIKFRIKDYEQRREKESNPADKQVYTDGIKILTDKLFLEENFDIEHQKAEYEATGDVFASRTFTEIPLNKRLNGLYDNFNAVVLFYDGLTNEEIISKLENAPTLEEKKQIVKDNVEITHMVIREATCSRKCIALKGKIDGEYSDPSNPHTNCLPPKYADWANLTEADCEEIANEELKEYLLNKIK